MNSTKKTPADVASEEPEKYGKKKLRPAIKIKTKAEMANMDSPFPDETDWALELESDAKKREEREKKLAQDERSAS